MYTYGIELELGNTDNTKELPEGWYRTGDPDVMNTKPYRLACDPEDKDYKIGGEFNSTPSHSLEEMEQKLVSIFDTHSNAAVNHRCVAHLHIAWPGIREDLISLKNYLQYSCDSHKWLIDNVWKCDVSHPLMNGITRRFLLFDSCKMPDYKKEVCDKATTIQEFKDGFATQTNGKVNPLSIRRYYINIYSCLKNGGSSIEHRHFFPSTDINELMTGFKLITRFADEARSGTMTPVQEWATDLLKDLPKECEYDHELELLWQKTNYKTNNRDEVNLVRQKLIEEWDNDRARLAI